MPEHGDTGYLPDFFGNIDELHFKPIAQGYLYWKHTWSNDASLTGRFGVAERPGEFVFGGEGPGAADQESGNDGRFQLYHAQCGGRRDRPDAGNLECLGRPGVRAGRFRPRLRQPASSRSCPWPITARWPFANWAESPLSAIQIRSSSWRVELPIADCSSREFRRNFRTTGAILPSGRRLSAALVHFVRESAGQRPRRILEVGPGTGAVTRHLIRSMQSGRLPRSGRVEPELCRLPQRPLPFRSRVPTGGPPLPRAALPDREPARRNRLRRDSVRAADEQLCRGGGRAHSRHPPPAWPRPGATVSFFEYMGIRRVKATFSGQAERTRLRGIGQVVGRLLKDARNPPRPHLDQCSARLCASRAVLACSVTVVRRVGRVSSPPSRQFMVGLLTRTWCPSAHPAATAAS